jgi:uncharacterized protein (DUF885 family)
VRAVLLTDIAPAYRRFVDWLEADLPNAPVGKVGVGQLPNGGAWYEAALFLNTSTPLTAEQIHQTGLAEVARIRAEIGR